MRPLRLKPAGQEMFYHVYNRVAGSPTHLPFGDVEKEQFIALLTRLCQLYTVEVLAFVVMSNHFHILGPVVPGTKVLGANGHQWAKRVVPGTKVLGANGPGVRCLAPMP